MVSGAGVETLTMVTQIRDSIKIGYLGDETTYTLSANMSEKPNKSFTEDEIARFKKEFKEVVEQKLQGFDGFACPVCKNDQFAIVGPNLISTLQLKEYSPQDSPFGFYGAQNLPSIPVVCETCGFTLYFNLYGLLKEELLRFPPYDSAE